MNSILLFFCIVLVAFLQGFQNKNITGNHYLLAAITSMLLGGAGVLLFKVMPSASGSEIAAYIAAGPVGVLSSMLVHNRFVKKELSTYCPECGKPRES